MNAAESILASLTHIPGRDGVRGSCMDELSSVPSARLSTVSG